MKVVEQSVTVLRNAEEPGLTLFMGGYRVALTLDEARMLASAVGNALSEASPESGEMGLADLAESAADHAAIVARVTEQVISWAQIAESTQRK